MEYPTYENIKGDMLGILPAFDDIIPQIKVYFEDKEAEWFFKQLLEIEKFDSKSCYGYDLTLVSAKLGCDNLRTLYTIDDYFRQVIIVFDNDVLLKDRITPIMEKSKTILALPAIVDDEVDNEEIRTPEFQIYNYLLKLLRDTNHPYWNNLPHRYNIELIKDSIIDTFPREAGKEKLRVVRKEWFNNNVVHFEKTNLMAHFYKDNIQVITPFINDFKTAIETLINK